MRKFLLAFLLLCSSFHYAQAQQYDLKEKESLKRFLRQASSVDGKLNLHRVGLSTNDTITWSTSDTWIKKLRGVTFYQDIDTKIDHIAGFEWSYLNLEGDFYCSDFLYLSKVDLYKNQLNKLVFTNCPSISYVNCGVNYLTKLQLGACNELQILECGSNLLSTIDLSSAEKLTRLYCSYNQLSTIDVSACHNLQYLACSFNKLSSLDLTANNSLSYLHTQSNQLTTLDLSGKSALRTVICNVNKLTSLNLSSCNSLETLSCGDNQLSELVLTDCRELLYIGSSNNKISSLDLSFASKLNNLYCQDNQLVDLRVSSSKSLEYGDCKNNQLLYSRLAPVLDKNPYQIKYNIQLVVDGGEVTYLDSINLSAEYNLRSNLTSYQWKDDNKAIQLKSNGKGIFYLGKEYLGKTLLCEMTNSGFSGLKTQYQVKVVSPQQEPLQLIGHLSIAGYRNKIATGETFELHLPLSNNNENVKLGLYTYSGAYLCDFVADQLSDSVFICTMPKVGNGICVIQPYVQKEDGTKEIITRPDKSHFIDKLPVTAYLPPELASTRSVAYDVSETASVSRHMRLTLPNTDYWKVAQNVPFSVYIAAGQKNTSIGIFNKKGVFYGDIVKSSYGDTYTCVITNSNMLGDFIIMPYRIEDGNIKVVEREAGSELIDRMPLYVEYVNSSQRSSALDENQNIQIYLDDDARIIYVKGLEEKASYEIYSLSGMLVSKSEITNNSIDAKALNSGVYIVKVTTLSGNTTVSKINKK